jgi:CspA family cold shock protein
LRPPRNDRQRPSRRRGFDDDNFYDNAPPGPPSFPAFMTASAGPESEATVKWYNGEKGYGFVALSDGSGDVFLHANALQAAGVQTVSPGATLRIRVGQGQKGRQVDQVVSVDESTASAAPPRGGPRSDRGGGGGGFGSRPPRSDGPRRQVDLSTAVDTVGTVKWYNPDKGFGFITPQSGGKDVFIHATVLERAGLGPLQEGQTVRMGVVQGAKGPEAGTISLE